jgi:hypothetical protein
MSNWCSYEWCIEEYNNDADDPEAEIVDLNFGDKLIEVGFSQNKFEKLVLVRDSQQGKLWAYVDESHMLPKHFYRPEEDGKYYETDVEIPKRFHREIARVACGGR